MITCERCQTENIDGSQYCDECGAALPGTASSGKKYTSDDGGGSAAGEARVEAAAGEARAGGAGQDGASGAHASSGPIEPVEPPAERRRGPAEVIPMRQSQPVAPQSKQVGISSGFTARHKGSRPDTPGVAGRAGEAGPPSRPEAPA